MLAGESDDGLVRALPGLQVVADGVEVLDCTCDAVGDHHRPRFAADPPLSDDLVVEVVDHDLRLQPDRVVVPLDEASQLPLRLLDVELRVVLHPFRQLVVAHHRRVVLQHIEDEALLDRLLHRVGVEGAVLDGAVGLRVRSPEDLQRLVLRRGREGEVAGVREQLAGLHQAIDLILVSLLFASLAGFGECPRDRGARLPALARVSLVDDDREPAPALLVADLVEDERELLDRRDDDLLAALDEPAQVAGTVGVTDRRSDLGVLFDRGVNLLIEDDPVGDDDDRVENRRCVFLKPDQLVRQPGDRIALPAACRVLDQVAFAGAVRCHVGQ